jgi:hypothetical protein
LKVRFLILFFLLTFCSGWTSRTHQMIVVEASKLTPYELKLLIKAHKEDILAGAILPLRGVKDESHYLLVDGSFGKAHLRIDSEVTALIKEMRSGKLDLGDFCRRLGIISHFIAEVNNPLLTGDLKRESGWFYNNFVKYTDSKIDTFARTFDGYENVFLESGDFQGFAIASAIRSAGWFRPLKDIYEMNRRKNLGYDFDEKSIPYATAALAYNYSVTDTAKVWYYIWRSLKGDMSYAPYDNKTTARK